MDLQPSKLGTKQYWNEFYENERSNYARNSVEQGESWFSDSGAEEKVVEYVCDLGGQPAVLDLGTGNGRLLFALREEQVQGQFLGIDYSPQSVEFARKAAESEGFGDVKFETVDFLQNPHWTTEQFDVVLDKGTLDAIALSGQTYGDTPAVRQYVQSVLPLVKPGGALVITSCNFTQTELADLVGHPYEPIEYPTFSFGGSSGSTVVTLAFTCGQSGSSS